MAFEYLQFLPKQICLTLPPSVYQWHMYQSPTYLWVFAFISAWKHSNRFSMSDRAMSDSPLLLNKKKSDDEVVSSTPNLMYLTMWHLNFKMCEQSRQDMRTVYSNVRFIRQCGLTNLCSVVSGWFVALVSFSSHCSILSGKLENTSRLTFKIAMNDLLERINCWIKHCFSTNCQYIYWNHVSLLCIPFSQTEVLCHHLPLSSIWHFFLKHVFI